MDAEQVYSVPTQPALLPRDHNSSKLCVCVCCLFRLPTALARETEFALRLDGDPMCPWSLVCGMADMRVRTYVWCAPALGGKGRRRNNITCTMEEKKKKTTTANGYIRTGISRTLLLLVVGQLLLDLCVIRNSFGVRFKFLNQI